jgi:hypothetical protein
MAQGIYPPDWGKFEALKPLLEIWDVWMLMG